MAALIVVGLLLTRLPGHGKPQISEEKAVSIARPQAKFTPQGHNIRLIHRGIPPRAFWAVSFWIPNSTGGYSKTTVVLLDANTGRIDEVRRGT
jgi:hypothetical protein